MSPIWEYFGKFEYFLVLYFPLKMFAWWSANFYAHFHSFDKSQYVHARNLFVHTVGRKVYSQPPIMQVMPL